MSASSVNALWVSTHLGCLSKNDQKIINIAHNLQSKIMSVKKGIFSRSWDHEVQFAQLIPTAQSIPTSNQKILLGMCMEDMRMARKLMKYTGDHQDFLPFFNLKEESGDKNATN